MAPGFVVDPTLATVGTPLQLQPDTTTQLQTFQDWLEHHQLLAETVGVTDPSQTLKLLLLWGGKEMRKLAGDAGVVQTNTEGGGAAADTLNGAIEKILKKLRGRPGKSVELGNVAPGKGEALRGKSDGNWRPKEKRGKRKKGEEKERKKKKRRKEKNPGKVTKNGSDFPLAMAISRR